MTCAAENLAGSPAKWLLNPLEVGPRTAPSRILFGPHATNLSWANGFSARHAAYYRERAVGGAGVIVLEEVSVHPSDWPYERAVHGFAPGIVDGFRRAATGGQEAGALVFASIGHSGGQGTSMHTQRPLLAPSPVPEVASREVPQPLEARRVRELVVAYASVATAARHAGLDGVEVNAGQHSLVRQFVSGLTNLRDDGYGGDRERRLRFPTEVIEAVREAIGPDLVLGLRLSLDEYAPWAGITPEEGIAIALALAERARIDYLVATSGGIFTVHATRPGMHAPSPSGADLARQLRGAGFPAPIVAQGSIIDPVRASDLIVDGACEAVEMTRALISDPDLPRKVRAHTLDRIVPCILCNQDCRVRDTGNRTIGCVQNPRAGRELDLEWNARAASSRRRLLVVGAGPAGLTAAATAAADGHEVELWECSDHVGGAVVVAASAPGRSALLGAVAPRLATLERLGVTPRTGYEATVEAVLSAEADLVILATGARPRALRLSLGAELADALLSKPGLLVLDQRAALVGSDVLDTVLKSHDPIVVVYDLEGGFAGGSVAEALAKRGASVHFATPDLFLAQGWAKTLDHGALLTRLYGYGVRMHPQRTLMRVEGGALVLRERFGPEEERIERTAALVVCDYEVPDDALYLPLRDACVPVARAGDAVTPRNIGAAVLEGARAVALLDGVVLASKAVIG